MQKPLVIITLAYIAGILLGQGFLYFPHTFTVGIGIGASAALLFLRFGRLSLHSFALTAVSCFVGAAAYLFSVAWFPANHVFRSAPSDSAQHEITGRIISPLDRDPDRTSATLALSSIDGKPVSGKARMTIRDNRPSVGYGDSILAAGRIFETRGYLNPGGFDYPAYLAQNGIYRTIAVKDSGRITPLIRGTGIFRSIQDLRERMRQSFLAATSGPGSAILQAMVLGEEGGLTEEIRDQFMTAGVTHIISISGSHLGMVALLCFGFIRGLLILLPEAWYHRLTLFTEPRKIAAWLTLPLVAFYALLAGGQTATIRSLIMISAGLFALILDRDHALTHALSLAALASLIENPQALFDLSFQFSYLSVLVIAAVVSLWKELGIATETRLQKMRNSIVMLIVISLATSLATGPLAARYFHQLSAAGILANLFVIPFAGMIVVPLGLFSAILSLGMAALPLAGLNQIVADSFVGLVGLFARLPCAEMHTRTPGILWLLLYTVMLTSGFLSLRIYVLARFHPLEQSRRPPFFLKTVFVLSGVCILIMPLATLHRHEGTRLIFLDVGQGDCALVVLASGKTVLIDGGGTFDNRFDIGRRIVAPFLWHRGTGTLDLVILSHPHPDHMNGLLYVLRKFPIGEIWTHGFDRDLPGYDALRQVIAEQKIPHLIVSAATPEYKLGNSSIRILHPSEDFEAWDGKAYAAENDRSLVVRIADDNGVFLFPGDIGVHAEESLICRGTDVKCDVMKVPHHGSRSSSSPSFLSAAKPAIAVVSAGKGNLYGHPAGEVLERYDRAGARLFRTDVDGAVLVGAGDGKLNASSSRDLQLQRIDLRDPDAWQEHERRNLQCLWIRRWEI
jgi:competence protein ComEC